MGTDKRVVRLLEDSLLDRALALLESVADDIVIAAGAEELNGHEDVGRQSVVRDEIPDRGPMGGLLSGLRAIRHARAVVIPLDMPLLTKGLLSYLIEVSPGWEITVPRWPRLEPLVGVYSTACLRPMEGMLRRRGGSVARFIRSSGLRVRYVTFEEISAFGSPEGLFLNINRPEDLRRAETVLREWPRDPDLRVQEA